MDRNRKQNSYKNVVFSRGRADRPGPRKRSTPLLLIIPLCMVGLCGVAASLLLVRQNVFVREKKAQVEEQPMQNMPVEEAGQVPQMEEPGPVPEDSPSQDSPSPAAASRPTATPLPAAPPEGEGPAAGQRGQTGSGTEVPESDVSLAESVMESVPESAAESVQEPASGSTEESGSDKTVLVPDENHERV